MVGSSLSDVHCGLPLLLLALNRALPSFRTVSRLFSTCLPLVSQGSQAADRLASKHKKELHRFPGAALLKAIQFRKSFSFLLRLGWRNFLRAFASI